MLSGQFKSPIERRFLASLIALSVLGVIVVSGTWYASGKFADQLAVKQTLREVDAWQKQTLSFLSLGKDAFVTEKVYPADAKIFNKVVTSSNVYRVTLYTKDGRVFWSTNTRETGNQLDVTELYPLAGSSGPRVTFADIQEKDIDRTRLRQDPGSYNPSAVHRIARVYNPVIQNGQFVGAVGLMLDTSGLISWFGTNMNRAGMVLSAAFSVIFLTVLLAGFRYARERQINIQALTEARDEAVEVQGKLEQVNEDVVKLNQELNQNVTQLREAQDEIIRKGKMAQLGQLTATVAHDLRNPLGAVRTAAFLIERKTKEKGLGIEKPLERISNGVSRCDDIITELLDFARSRELQLETIDLDAWLAGLLQEQAQRLPEAVSLQCHQGLDGREIEIDPGRIQRALVNLWTNASEAMVGAKGDDPSSFSTQDPQIIVSTALTGRGVEISVIDNGPGISDEDMQKIMEPLFTTKSFGVGLGLPSVEKILQQHGGGLQVSSQTGSGTTMTAWFPITQALREAA